MVSEADRQTCTGDQRASEGIDRRVLTNQIREILARRPVVGLAVGVVDGGGLSYFGGYGSANLASGAPVTQDTVFRIGSITKTVTAVAVMQLRERALVDLDAPANDYLASYRLIPESEDGAPATVRHLLTHTAGIPDVLHVGDLLHPTWGPFTGRPPLLSVPAGEDLPSLTEYYRGVIRQVAEPGKDFAYSNHGFATLGQIVEDVSGMSLDSYFREHIFDPLGMTTTGLSRSEKIASRSAVGYALGRCGPAPVPDRDWIGLGADGIYSSVTDLARYAWALLDGGDDGSILQSESRALMYESHYSPDPRLVSMGLGFFRHDAGGHRIVSHDGILPGFNSSLWVAPDDGVAVVGLTNGSIDAMVWLADEIGGLLHRILALPDEATRTDLPHHPELWRELCGRYRLPPVADWRGRMMMGGGARVLVRGGRLVMQLLTPIPALYRGLPLLPDAEDDPYAFRLDLSRFGMAPVRLIFDCGAGRGRRTVHTDLGRQPISLYERPSGRHRQDRAPR